MLLLLFIKKGLTLHVLLGAQCRFNVHPFLLMCALSVFLCMRHASLLCVMPDISVRPTLLMCALFLYCAHVLYNANVRSACFCALSFLCPVISISALPFLNIDQFRGQ